MGDWCPLCGQNSRFGILCANPSCDDESLTPETVEVAGLASKACDEEVSFASEEVGDAFVAQEHVGEDDSVVNGVVNQEREAGIPDKVGGTTTVLLQGIGLKDLGETVIHEACREVAEDGGLDAPEAFTCLSESLVLVQFPRAVTAAQFVVFTGGEIEIQKKTFVVSLHEEEDVSLTEEARQSNAWDGYPDGPAAFERGMQEAFAWLQEGSLETRTEEINNFMQLQTRMTSCKWCKMGECWTHQGIRKEKKGPLPPLPGETKKKNDIADDKEDAATSTEQEEPKQEPKQELPPVTTVWVQGEELLDLSEDAIEQACKDVALQGGFSGHETVKRWSEFVVHVEFPDALAAAKFVATTQGELMIEDKVFAVTLAGGGRQAAGKGKGNGKRKARSNGKETGECRWCRLGECWTHQNTPQAKEAKEAERKRRKLEEASGPELSNDVLDLQISNSGEISGLELKRQRLDE